MALQADSAGFLIGGQPIKPTRTELTLLERLRDDVRAIRRLLERKDGKPGTDKRAANDPGDEAPKDGGVRGATVRPATPRLTTTSALTKSVATGDMGRAAMPAGKVKPLEVKIIQSVATPKRATPDRPVIDRAMPMRDASGRFVAQAKPVKPELAKPAKTTKTEAVDAATGERDSKGRFTGGGKEQDGETSKIGKLLGDIKDKISGPDLSGGEEVDPNIKAAQEIAGVAGSALNGVKAVGGVLGTVATPMLSGARGLFKSKPHDAPTPWFKRFFNELRGLRREESVFNRAQLRTLKEIEAKPGEGKGGGILGMLMMLIGPLIAAIGAALTAGFGLLMKLPGMGLLAKLATGLMPAALMAKKPITQPTTTPGAPGAPGKSAAGKATVDPKTGLPVPDTAGKPEAAPKKPGLLARAGQGAMGVLKRVPLLGAALAAVSIGSGVYESESDDTTTRAEKDKNTGKAIGGGGGAIAGMMSGGAAGVALGAFAGPIGAAIGGVVGAVAGGFFGEKAGAIVGEKVGGWVTDIRNADIPGTISRAWTSTTDTMAKGWGETTKWFEGKWGDALKLFGGIWDKAKEVFDDLSLGVTNLLAKFGIDLPAIKQKAKDAAAAVSGAVGAAKDKVVQGATAAMDYGKEKAGQAGEALKNSAMGRSVGVVAMGLKNVFEREDGSKVTLDGGTKAWRNNNPGNLRMSDFSKSQGAIGSDRDGFAIFPSLEAGAKAKENLIFGGKNYKDKTLTEAIARYAPPNENNTGRYQAAILSSVGGQNKRMSDYTPAERAAITAAMTKMEGFEVGKTTVTPARPATPATATNSAPAIPAVPASTTVVTAGARAIPQMPSIAVEPPKVPDFQPVTAGLASTMGGGQEQRPSVIVVGNKTPVGRDLSNRPLAHIVTGGLSGS